ncbi:hypothetical protein [Roseibium sp. RKSG952]|uniref:hypothetical protein n=1 Tax=Roseibium sp. RKSG952 TaxID=2529384 RepID=UPI0012BCF327|nr:hypothetical protein [Roseibium sp. RKSG952]MTH95628.1 hypothetical protein [Roseibium sp. RKSG952]
MTNGHSEIFDITHNVRTDLREQLFVSKGGFLVGTLVALGSVATSLSRLVPGHDPESSLKRMAPKTQRRLEREMKSDDPEERRRRVEDALRGPGLISPMRAYRAMKRNERMAVSISSIDPAMEPTIKAKGAKAVFESEYALILKFLTADPQDRQNMDVNALGIRNAAVRAQLQWMQTYPNLAKDILSGDVVETISNLSEQIGNRGEFLKRQHVRIGGMSSRRDLAREEAAPSLSSTSVPVAGFGPVASIRRDAEKSLDRDVRA